MMLTLCSLACCSYVAVRLTTDEELASGSITRQQLLETENQFFATNPLLKGLRSERWGAITLKKLVVEYQSNFISHRIPDLSKQVRRRLHEFLARSSRLCPRHSVHAIFAVGL